MSDIKELLEGEIRSQIEMVSALEAGSDERTSEIKNLETLYKLRIEENKIERDFDEKRERREMENDHHIIDVQFKEQQMSIEDMHRTNETELKERQWNDEAELRGCDQLFKEKELSEKVKDRWINVGLQVGITLISVGAYNYWFGKGLKFEEDGVVTSPWIKNLMSKMLPKK